MPNPPSLSDALFAEALLALASGAHDEAVARLRAVRSRAQESGDTHAAARAYVALIGAGRQRGDARAQGADLRALERAALNLPGSAFEVALAVVSSRPLATMDELDVALADLEGVR